MSAHLFDPLVLRGVTIPNRLWVPPMCQWSAVGGDGQATDWHQVNYGAYARGGAGLVMVEATAVAPEGRIGLGDLGAWDDSQIPSLARLADLITSFGAVPAIQLGHAGRKASSPPSWEASTLRPGVAAAADADVWDIVGPSPVANTGLAVPRQLSPEEILGLVAAFEAAGRRAVEAGFQAIEIHAAHGYLVHEFLSPIANHRTDDFGGSLANRARFLLAVVKRLREALGPDRILMARFSATDWIEGGWDLDQTVEVVGWAKQAGLDHADISTGGLNEPPVPVGPGYQVPFAAAVRERTGISVNAVGLITSAEQAEAILAADQADAVMVGRPFMRNPNLGLSWAFELGAGQRVVPPPLSPARWLG